MKLTLIGYDANALKRVIAERFLSETQKNFDSEGEYLGGQKWAEWSKNYLKRQLGRLVKQSKSFGVRVKMETLRISAGHESAARIMQEANLKILQKSGVMRRETSYRIGAREIVITNNRKYAPAHQFGSPKANIPKREFLVWNDKMKALILDEIRAYFTR